MRNHFPLIDPHDRTVGHCCGACHAPRLACQASLAKEVISAQDSDDGFFAVPGNDRELDPSFPEIENGVCDVTLSEYSLALRVICQGFSFARLGQKLLKIEGRFYSCFHSATLYCPVFHGCAGFVRRWRTCGLRRT